MAKYDFLDNKDIEDLKFIKLFPRINKDKYMICEGKNDFSYESMDSFEIFELATPNTDNVFMEIFYEMIKYLKINEVNFNSLTIRPKFGLLVREKDFTKVEDIKRNRTIGNIVAVTLDEFYYNNGKMFPEDFIEDTKRTVICSLENLIVGLNERGLELNGITCYKDIEKKIKNKEAATGEVTANLKRNYYKKKNI